MTRCITLFAVFLSLTGNVAYLVGQDGTQRRGFPRVGDALPAVTVFDEQGNKFSTSSLRGQYSVLVFGCLT